MALVFVRPSIQHKAANVLSSTSSTGLTVQEPTPTAGNDGNLRLRCSGTPTAATSLTVTLQSSGAPLGAAGGDDGYAHGASVVWATTSAPSTVYGYVDTPYVVRAFAPLTYDNAQYSIGRMRELPDGTLGVLRHETVFNNDHQFHRISSYTSVSTANWIVQGIASYVRADFVILPSGRLVLFTTEFSYSATVSYYSDDNGATWTLLSKNVCVGGSWTAEVVGDIIVMLNTAPGVSAAPVVYVSRDGGATATLIGTFAATCVDIRTCVHNGRVIVASHSATSTDIIAVSPGGLDTVLTTDAGANWSGQQAIVARDDGTLWVFGVGSSAANKLDIKASVSNDGGLTWYTYADPILDCEDTPAAAPIYQIDGCMWKGQLVLGMQTTADTGSDNNCLFLGLGGWSTITDRSVSMTADGAVYSHSYVPIDVPVAFGWTATSFGTGGTLTNQNYLQLVCTPGNNQYWTAPTAVWNPAAGDSRRARFRIKVNSGSHTGGGPELSFNISDGANTTQIMLKFGTATTRITNVSGSTIADVTVDQTGWVEWFVAMHHDSPATKLRASVWYKPDSTDVWVQAFADDQQAEAVGTTNTLRMGSIAGGVSDFEIAYLGIADDDNSMAPGFTSPDDLNGRPLSSLHDFYLTSGIHLGAYGNGGIAGDTYTAATRYTYGPERVWSDLRPSSRTQSQQDNVTWSVTFDAGATALFRGNFAAAFGTNMRTARWQMNATDSWGAPSVDAALDATLSTFTVGAGVRGVGYLGPTVSPNWRAHQWRSNGDSRRYFIEVNSVSYEITDNDEDRIYVDGVDFGASSGTATLYGDRMAGTFTFGLYRYARFAVTSGQQTADDVYRLGTPIVGKQWTPNQLYDNGFVDRIEPNVTTTDAENGSSISYRRGPAIDTLSIQWPPLDRLRADVEIRLRDFYRSIDGALTPVVLWRDTSSMATLSLVQVREVYSATNVLGELDNAVTRIDQLVLREVW